MQAVIYVNVGYIGKKAQKTDTVFGTRLTFTPGQVHPVDSHTANKMVQHVNVYALESSDRYKAFKEKLDAGVLPDTSGDTITGPSIADQVTEKTAQLRAELNKLPKKESIEQHEVTKALNVQFDADDTRPVMTEKVVEAYQAHISAKLTADAGGN